MGPRPSCPPPGAVPDSCVPMSYNPPSQQCFAITPKGKHQVLALEESGGLWRDLRDNRAILKNALGPICLLHQPSILNVTLLTKTVLVFPCLSGNLGASLQKTCHGFIMQSNSWTRNQGSLLSLDRKRGLSPLKSKQCEHDLHIQKRRLTWLQQMLQGSGEGSHVWRTLSLALWETNSN